jgi:hypothetical protein
VTHQIPEWLYIAFFIVTAIGVGLQAIAMLGIMFAIRGAVKQARDVSKMAEDHIVPAMTSAKLLIDEVGPKVKIAAENSVTLSQKAIEISQRAAAASEHVVEIAQTLREQSAHASESFGELLKKAEAQAERVDEMVTGTLDTIAQATSVWQRTFAGPLRQVNGIMNGLRAGFDVLRSREREAHAAADGDHFV